MEDISINVTLAVLKLRQWYKNIGDSWNEYPDSQYLYTKLQDSKSRTMTEREASEILNKLGELNAK